MEHLSADAHRRVHRTHLTARQQRHHLTRVIVHLPVDHQLRRQVGRVAVARRIGHTPALVGIITRYQLHAADAAAAVARHIHRTHLYRHDQPRIADVEAQRGDLDAVDTTVVPGVQLIHHIRLLQHHCAARRQHQRAVAAHQYRRRRVGNRHRRTAHSCQAGMVSDGQHHTAHTRAVAVKRSIAQHPRGNAAVVCRARIDVCHRNHGRTVVIQIDRRIPAHCLRCHIIHCHHKRAVGRIARGIRRTPANRRRTQPKQAAARRAARAVQHYTRKVVRRRR